MIYIITFLISVAFIWIGTKKCTRQRMTDGTWETVRLKKIPVIIGLLVPVLLASMRATSVGADVTFYVVPFFDRALSSNTFSGYMELLGGYTNDIGYCLLNYIISKFTQEIGWLFFFSELIIIFATFAGCWQLRGKAYPWLSMLFFYFLFYNITLSTVRQSCALAISFYAFAYLLRMQFRKDSIIKSMMYIMVASTFHTTAIFELGIIFFSYCIFKNKITVIKFTLIAFIGCLFAKLFASRFLSIAGNLIGLITSKYTDEFFLNTSAAGASGYISIIMMSVIVVILQLLYIKNERHEYSKKIDRIFLGLNLLYVFAMIFLSNFAFIPRIMYYIQFSWCVSFAQCVKIVKNNRFNSTAVIIILFLVTFIFWEFFFILGNVHETYPYIVR